MILQFYEKKMITFMPDSKARIYWNFLMILNMIPVMLLAPILFSYHVFPRKEKNFDLKCNNFYITKKISLIFLYFNG